MDAEQTAGGDPRDHPAHSIRPRTRPARVAAIAGLAAAAIAVALGTAALITVPAPPPPAQQTLREITATPSAAVIPLSDSDLLALLDQPPDYGPLEDRRRLASCLSGLDYPASTPVLGAQPVDIDGHPAMLLLLPGDTLDAVIALAVAPTCSSVDTGLLADTMVRRP